MRISHVSPDRRPIALRLLFARFPVEEQETRLTETLRSVERGQLDLDGLLLAEENGQPVGAALMMMQSDGVALVWPPVITCQTHDEAGVENALMTRICQEVDGKAKLAQVLLAPDNEAECQLLGRHGFEYSTEMFFMARPLTKTDSTASPDPIKLDQEIFTDANSDRFASVIERTYRESLDCPFLNGFRNGNDALASHRLSGRFDPASWRLYRTDSEDVGVLLMNEHPEQDAIELVYFGIVPEFRGLGNGRRVLAHGLQAAALTGRAVMFLAVDCGNIYANSLYAESGFSEVARRRVMLRRSRQMARK